MRRTSSNPCPSGWPRHTEPEKADGDTRRRNALGKNRKGERWERVGCVMCSGFHVVPVTIQTLIGRNPRVTARLGRDKAARSARKQKAAV